MPYKYSVILCTLAPAGANAWGNPREVLKPIAGRREGAGLYEVPPAQWL